MTNWSVVVCGDCAPSEASVEIISADPSRYFGDTLPILRDTQLAILNLEGVIGCDGSPPMIKDGISIPLHAHLAKSLKAVPFQAACLANNHTFDYGPQGLLATIRALKEQGITPIGAGLAADEAIAPAFFQFGEVRLAIFNIAEGEEASIENHPAGAASFDIARLTHQMAACKEHADIIVVIAHAGREHLPVPAPYIRLAYRSLVDAGADLVIGHHPHVPQGMEEYKKAVIAYSLGNFMMWMDGPLEFHRTGYFLKIHYHGMQREKIEVIPYKILVDKIRLLSTQEQDWFNREFTRLNDVISADGQLDGLWEAYADRWLQTQGMREIAENSVALAGGRISLIALLKSNTSGGSSGNFLRRMIDRILWRTIHALERGEKDLISMDTQTRLASAVLRNRYDTPAHRELYLTSLARLMNGKVGSAPAWMYQWLDDWQVSAYLKSQ